MSSATESTRTSSPPTRSPGSRFVLVGNADGDYRRRLELLRAWTAADRARLRQSILTRFGLERMVSEQESALVSLV